MNFFVVYLLFTFVLFPLFTLWHELGHALMILLLTDNEAHIQIGGQPQQEETIAEFNFGRIHLHWAQWFTLWVGFHWYLLDGVTRGKNALIALGGVIASFVLMIIFVILTVITNGDLQIFFGACTTAILAQLFMSILPITYPPWLFSYAGYPSDGRRFLDAWYSDDDDEEIEEIEE